MDGVVHGLNGYRKGQCCRCDICRSAWADYGRARRAERKAMADAGTIPESVAHGASTAKNWGCRCDVCDEALRLANATRPSRTVSPRRTKTAPSRS